MITLRQAKRQAALFLAPIAICVSLAGCSSGGGSTTTAPPQPPVANVRGPYTGVTGTAVAFNGSSSSDPRSEALTYAWTFGDGGTANTVSPTHSYTASGTYTVTLTVTNTDSLSNTASTTATISASAQPPVANAGGPYTATSGTAVSFNGSGSTDPKNETLTYAWTFGDGATATTASPTHTYAAIGAYVVTLVVTNTDNLTASAATTATITPRPEVNACKTPVSRVPGPTPSANAAGNTFTGTVMAGNLPLVGSSVQLYAAGNTGNGSAPTALGSAVITSSTGTFSISTAYTCPYNLSLLYVVARGGHTGALGSSNSNIELMSALGLCNSISGNPSFTINEATTVASAYALQQFLSVDGKVGASATNFSGLSLAAAGAANLVNLSTGQAPGPNFPTTGTAPTLILNSLANALDACIVTGGSACTGLYTAATVSGTAPSNTLDAILNIAKHPAANVAALYTLSAATSVFTPANGIAPSDWTMFARYTGAGMNGPSALGIDSTGSVRVSNYFNKLSLFSNTGVPTIPTGVTDGVLNESYGMALDNADNIWVANEQTGSGINGGFGSISVFNSSGSSITGYSQGGLNFPVAISVDTGATNWVVDYGNSHVTLLNNAGTPLSGTSGYTTSQFSFPVAVATDSKCYGFVTNQGSNTITRIAPDGTDFESFTTGGGGSGVAVDAGDNVWVANYFASSVGLVTSTGTVVSSAITGGGIHNPQGIAIDGGGNVWVANYRGPSISELNGSATSSPGSAISPSAGYGPDAALSEAFAIAIDAGGNVWVSNFGSNTLTEFVGMAVPVKTPLLGPVAIP